MAGDFPFSSKANRVSIFGFYEASGFGLEFREEYYKWRYHWARAFVANDSDRRESKALEFAHHPVGQHADANFHLHDYRWATALMDLGKFIENTILAKLNEATRQKLEQDHTELLDRLKTKRASTPRPPARDVGCYRHV